MTDNPQTENEVRMTEPQKWALRAIAEGYGGYPAQLGQRMMERPGASDRPDKRYKAQGYGRMGGAMMARLEKKGWVRLTRINSAGWCPTKATITVAGRDALANPPRLASPKPLPPTQRA